MNEYQLHSGHSVNESWKVVNKNMNSGTSLVALGLRLPTCVRGTQVGSLVGELRSCMLSRAGEKKKRMRTQELVDLGSHPSTGSES